MRLHPVLLNHIRKCNKKYKIPGSDLEIDEGVMISIPLSAMHKDPQFYDDADKFLPERFLDEELVQKNQFIFTPFGIGPRQCIGKFFHKNTEALFF
jgi:cytochrome P450